jgi:hypothetical protein
MTSEQVNSLMDYLMVRVVGQGEVTLETCTLYYGRPDHPACRRF